MPIPDLEGSNASIWMTKTDEAILYISFSCDQNRKLFLKAYRGRTFLEKEGYTVEKVKTGDAALVLLRREYASGNWACSDQSALDNLIGQAEEEEEEVRIDWAGAIKKGKIKKELITADKIERDFNDRLILGELAD